MISLPKVDLEKNHRRDNQNNFMTLKVNKDIPEVYLEPYQTYDELVQHMKNLLEKLLITHLIL